MMRKSPFRLCNAIRLSVLGPGLVPAFCARTCDQCLCDRGRVRVVRVRALLRRAARKVSVRIRLCIRRVVARRAAQRLFIHWMQRNVLDRAGGILHRVRYAYTHGDTYAFILMETDPAW